ncbi:MAG TPA: ABC transporter permease subunit [Candidatus Thermoplasmatota archaeon]|nr:ABC transporter permease subunit [Candidatus Thermoplasmatota archaeon]
MNVGTRAVIWREYREYLQAEGKEKASIVASILVPILLPLLFAFLFRDYWRSTITTLSFGVFASMSVVMGFVPYSMAGERERHTLETLLTTRLTGRNIYWGKFIATTTFAVGVGAASTLTGVLVLTALFAGAWANVGLALLGWIGAILVSVPVAMLGASFGLFVSARATTTQQAATKTSFLMMPFMMLVFVVPMTGTFAGFLLFEGTQVWTFIGLGAMPGLAAVAALVVAIVLLGLRRFERHRLMLT